MEFNTANGKTTAHEVVKATMPPLSECIRPYVLEQTPAVLSVGLRCKKYGYAFHWFAYKQPFLITPDKKRIQLEAIDDLPILRLDAIPTDDLPRQTYPGWYHERHRWDPTIEIARLGHHNAFKGVHRWIADTGSGYDLVNKPEITNQKKIRKAAITMEFATANGDTWADNVCEEYHVTLQKYIKPYVLDSTPSVLSVGRRCRLGYSFHWPASCDPYFVTPDGQIIMCEVLNYVPFINEHDPRCKPHWPNQHYNVAGPQNAATTAPANKTEQTPGAKI